MTQAPLPHGTPSAQHDEAERTDLLESQEQLRAFALSLLETGDPLTEIYVDHYGEPVPHQTLSAEAALREIVAFPCAVMEDDELLIEVLRGPELSSAHFYRLPMHGPLWLPLKSGDLVLSFHDHICNRKRSFMLSALGDPLGDGGCLHHAGKFLKVIAIE